MIHTTATSDILTFAAPAQSNICNLPCYLNKAFVPALVPISSQNALPQTSPFGVQISFCPQSLASVLLPDL